MEKIEFTRFIERYLDNKMQSSEKQWFEKELEGNMWLQKELELRRKADKIVSNLGAIDLRSKLMEAESRHKKATKIERAVKKIPVNYAAVFLGLILISTLVLLTGNSFDIGVYTDTAVDTYSINTASRAGSPTYLEPLAQGIELYNNKEFRKANIKFLAVPSDSKSAIQAKYYSALSSMQINEYGEAASSFTQVLEHFDNMFIEDSEYYLGLCKCKLGEMNKAKTIMEGIINSESRYKKEAKKILKKIR